MNEPDEATGGVAALAGRAIAIAENVEKTQAAIRRQQARSKRNVRWLIVSLVLDLLITAGLIFVNYQDCVRGNQFRAGQVQLWDHIIAVSTPPKHETPAERTARLAKLAAFRSYIRAQFRPVNCSRLYLYVP